MIGFACVASADTIPCAVCGAEPRPGERHRLTSGLGRAGRATTCLALDDGRRGTLGESPLRGQVPPQRALVAPTSAAAPGLSSSRAALVGLVAIGIGALLSACDRAEPQPQPQPQGPAWRLELPAGLPASSVDALLDRGHRHLEEGADLRALEDFYRVWSSQPDRASARLGARVVGERIVLDRLGASLEAPPELAVPPARPSGEATGGEEPAEGPLVRLPDEIPGARILGALPRDVILDGIVQWRSQLGYCYARELSVTPGLEGRVMLKLTVLDDGSVGSAVIGDSTLEHDRAERCLVDRFLEMMFPEVPGGGIVVAEVPIELALRG